MVKKDGWYDNWWVKNQGMVQCGCVQWRDKGSEKRQLGEKERDWLWDIQVFVRINMKCMTFRNKQC